MGDVDGQKLTEVVAAVAGISGIFWIDCGNDDWEADRGVPVVSGEWQGPRSIVQGNGNITSALAPPDV